MLEIKEAQEILKAGFAWANWTDKQVEAMKVAYQSMEKVRNIERFCIDCDGDERAIQPYEILDILK